MALSTIMITRVLILKRTSVARTQGMEPEKKRIIDIETTPTTNFDIKAMPLSKTNNEGINTSAPARAVAVATVPESGI